MADDDLYGILNDGTAPTGGPHYYAIPRRESPPLRLRFCGPCVRGEHDRCTGCDCRGVGTVCAGKPATSA